MAGTTDTSWPPPVGATVVSPAGVKYEVVGGGIDKQLGMYILLRGWQTFPVTRAIWTDRGYRVEEP